MALVKITTANFEEEVTNATQKVLVDFWADWCGPCKMVGPIIDQIAEEHDEIKVGKINVDEEPSLALKFKVMSIPTLAVFDKGEIVNKAVGVQSKSDIEAML